MSLDLRIALPITSESVFGQIENCVNTEGSGFYAQSNHKKVLIKHKQTEKAGYTLEKIEATVPGYIKCAHLPISAFELQKDPKVKVYYSRFSTVDEGYLRREGVVGTIYQESEETLFEIISEAPGEEDIDSPVFTCHETSGDLTLIGIIVSVGKALLIKPAPEAVASAAEEVGEERGDARIESKAENNPYGYFYSSQQRHLSMSKRGIDIDLMQRVEDPKTKKCSPEKISSLAYQFYLINGNKKMSDIHQRPGVSSSYTTKTASAFYKRFSDEYLKKITTWTDGLKQAKQAVDPKKFEETEFTFEFEGSDFTAELIKR